MSAVFQASGKVSSSGWILSHGGYVLGSRSLHFDEAVRHEWGEAVWTARILAGGEIAKRELAAFPRRGCF